MGTRVKPAYDAERVEAPCAHLPRRLGARGVKQFLKQMLRNPAAVIGLVILILAILIAVFGPSLFPNSPWRMVQRPFLPPFTLAKVPLGTDALGRDVFAGVIFGARVSLLVGLVSTLVALI